MPGPLSYTHSYIVVQAAPVVCTCGRRASEIVGHRACMDGWAAKWMGPWMMEWMGWTMKWVDALMKTGGWKAVTL